MKQVKSTVWKWAKWAAFAAVMLFALARVYYALTDDFRISNITYGYPYRESWVSPAAGAAEEAFLSKALDQPYHYLGKGAQSYAFGSADGKYVLKFFKFKHLRPSWFVDNLPSIGFLEKYKVKQQARKERKLFGVFQSYKLAFDVDREESGLHFVQLNVTGNPARTVRVIDKLGFERVIDLQSVPFLLQDRGKTLRDVISSHLQKGDVEGANARFGLILDMYSREYAKGVFDHDHGVMQNTGFIDDRPFHLDVGKLLEEDAVRERGAAMKDARLVTDKMNEWVAKHYPAHSGEIARYLDSKLDSLYGK